MGSSRAVHQRGRAGNRRSMNDDALRTYAEAFCISHEGKWELLCEIGSGNSASVYRLRTDVQTAALKIYRPRFLQGGNARIEKRRLDDQMSLRGHGHPNLIDFFDTGEIEDTRFLLMEYFPWQSLDRRLGTIKREEIAGIISKIASAAEYLEGKNFVHRDIKPENILISDDCQEVKLLDLGVMRPISTDDSDGTDQGYALPFVATARYSSPAYLFRDGTPTEDMWRALTFYQLGAVLHDLLMKRPLFDDEVRTRNRYRVAAAVLHTTPEVRAPDAPPWLVALARNCLVKDDVLRLNRISWNSFRSKERINIDELRRKLGLGKVDNEIGPDREIRVSFQERVKLRLDNGRDFLIRTGRHVLRKEKFPPNRMRKDSDTKSNSRLIEFCFYPGNVTEPAVSLCLVLRLSASEDSANRADLFLTSFLVRHGSSIPVEYDDELLWTTTFEDLKPEEDQLISLLTEKFVYLYAVAYDRLHIFEEGDDSTLQIREEI